VVRLGFLRILFSGIFAMKCRQVDIGYCRRQVSDFARAAPFADIDFTLNVAACFTAWKSQPGGLPHRKGDDDSKQTVHLSRSFGCRPGDFLVSPGMVR
jgi:hypothetical protein